MEEDQNELPSSVTQWWKNTEEFDGNGHFKIDLSDLSKLTPRVKLLREMERLDLVAAEGLDDLRQKLITYRSGEFWVPVGGIKKEEMDIPNVITILLVGLKGSGKSSLINMMYSILGRGGLIPFAQTSGESSNFTTMYLEEHNVVRSARSGFCVYDTRGIDINQTQEGLEKVSTWITNGVYHNQLCIRYGDEDSVAAESLNANRKYTKRKVNCVMVVGNLAEINKAFKCGDLKSLQTIRDLFQLPCVRKFNGSPILILTHGDMLKAEERISSRLRICEYVGIPENTGAYDIACLSEQGILPAESDPVTAFALTEAIYRSLILSDRSHLPKRKFLDWITMFLSWILCSIAFFFALLARFLAGFSHHNKRYKL